MREMHPHHVVATLILFLQKQRVVGDGERTVHPHLPLIWGLRRLDKSTHIGPFTQHSTWSPQRCGTFFLELYSRALHLRWRTLYNCPGSLLARRSLQYGSMLFSRDLLDRSYGLCLTSWLVPRSVLLIACCLKIGMANALCPFSFLLIPRLCSLERCMSRCSVIRWTVCVL